MNTKKEKYVTYEIASELRVLRFDEPCLAYYKAFSGNNEINFFANDSKPNTNSELNKGMLSCFAAPTWEQTINWFNKKHNITFISESTEYGLLWTIKSPLIDNSKNELQILCDITKDYLKSQETAILFLFSHNIIKDIHL